MYSIPPDAWNRIVAMYCSGPAACWLHSVERRVHLCSWQTFSAMLLERFGKDDHDALIRQLLHIRQQGTVAEYIIQFVALMDPLASYESSFDSKHYTMKFIDGLKYEIRSSVLLQRPKDLDTAYVLAALHEEVGDSSRSRRSTFPSAPATPKGPHPLPPPPHIDRTKFLGH